MLDHSFRPEVAEKIKFIVKKFDDDTAPLFKDWVSRILIWSDANKEYASRFRMMCCNSNGKVYPAEGLYDAETRVLFISDKGRRVFIDSHKGMDEFKDALVRVLVDLLDMVSFDVDAIAMDLGVRNYEAVRTFELSDHTYCLGITAFSSAAKDDWGFKGMCKVMGEDLVNI